MQSDRPTFVTPSNLTISSLHAMAASFAAAAADERSVAIVFRLSIARKAGFKKICRCIIRHHLLLICTLQHIMIDLGTGNNNKINWAMEDKQASPVSFLNPTTPAATPFRVPSMPVRNPLQTASGSSSPPTVRLMSVFWSLVPTGAAGVHRHRRDCLPRREERARSSGIHQRLLDQIPILETSHILDWDAWNGAVARVGRLERWRRALRREGGRGMRAERLLR